MCPAECAPHLRYINICIRHAMPCCRSKEGANGNGPPPITHPLVRRTFTAAAPRKIPGVAQWMEQPAEGASDKLRPSAWQQQHSLHKRGAWQQAAPQAKAASMLTSEDIRSGEPAQPPGPSVPDEQSAAAAGRVSSRACCAAGDALCKCFPPDFVQVTSMGSAAIIL